MKKYKRNHKTYVFYYVILLTQPAWAGMIETYDDRDGTGCRKTQPAWAGMIETPQGIGFGKREIDPANMGWDD